jgi:hypothetical protein
MRRTPAWLVAIGTIVGWASWPSVSQAGVWLTLAAGIPGDAIPTSQNEFWFDTPHGPSQIAVTSLTGGTTAEAVTGGGSVFFGGAGTPVLVNLSDGSAYIAGGGPPQAARTPGGGGGGGGGGGLASAAPTAGGTIPDDAALLGINRSEPDVGGFRELSATVTDSLGNPLGSGAVSVPDGGWWVLGLTPGSETPPVDPPPPPPEDPPTDPGPVDPPPPPDPDPIGPEPTPLPETPPPAPPGDGDGPVATPEPSTFMLVAFGGLSVRAWRRLRRKSGA